MMLTFFQWMNDLPFSKGLGASVWQFAIIQALHLVCLAFFAGGVLMLDLRLMGKVLKERPIAEVARNAQPWLVWGFLGLVVTGVPQMMQNAMREDDSGLFWFKMGFLFVALIYTVTLRRQVALSGDTGVASFKTKAVGFVSMLLWLFVAAPARLIGLFS